MFLDLFINEFLLPITISTEILENWTTKDGEIPQTTLEIFWDKLKEISTYGFTIEEFQKAMLLLCFIRFIIYSIKYNIFTSFKICAIGFISCILWAMALNDCIGIYYPNLALHPLLRNAYREEIMYREVALARAGERLLDDLVKQTNTNSYPFDWITPIFGKFPSTISHITDPIYVFIRRDFFETIKQFYKTNLRHLVSIFVYVGCVRVGKKYCPYHIRWHFTFITLYNTFMPYIFSCTMRARQFLYKVLIPQQRFEEAENMELYIGAWVFVHISFIMIAMIHAIFSQYFYIPFLTYSVELHVGKRPKTSIYSGGYTAWQDNFNFFNIKLSDTLRLWWGFLGKGTKNQRKNNKT
uniref:Uncharacterized protein n=1 Tax=Actinocyclus subtilis TaxID=1630683 RepID=A0A2U9NQK0_9STRA|nr:hypothetical protein ycf90 [Actinocyclus subtilis]AWT39206.1 hypothetical protein ycf90 [Actinocyclus subtilis]